MNNIKIKALSINEAWKGQRYKTKEYSFFEQNCLLLLPHLKIDITQNLFIKIDFGLSNPNNDIDNGIKPFLDILQKKYGFNDNKVYRLEVSKTITKKKQEYINFTIENIK